MAEFKKLSEVELLESSTDNATVLVEDGGEIKRVPKKAVGGAGGYVAVLTAEDLENPVVEFSDGPVISENYDEMYDVLCAGGSAYVDVTILMASQPSAILSAGVSPTNYDKYRVLVTSWWITDIGLMVFGMMPGSSSSMPVLFPNGSHNLDPVIEK